jgi:diacylglycerol kinase (ATP)
MEHFIKAFTYSCAGFQALLRERAFRQELFLLAFFFSVTALARGVAALLDVLPWGLLVLVVEALNTAVEKTVDLCTTQIHPLAKIAKDTASFACGTAIMAFLLTCLREFVK